MQKIEQMNRYKELRQRDSDNAFLDCGGALSDAEQDEMSRMFQLLYDDLLVEAQANLRFVESFRNGA